MAQQNNDRLMALAAVCFAASSVQQVARTGEIDDDSLSLMLNSILALTPEKPADVYPNKYLLQKGYDLIREQLGNSKQKDIEITRYIVGLLALERKLSKNKNALQSLADKLSQVERQLTHFSITDDNIVASLADIYSQQVSPLGARIQVVGKPILLQQKHNQNKIRALLLAGIRAAVLWRQLGGKRRHILFSRKQILNQLN
ncbi:high frequency lysogenization protein HflD [Flocculibacter collagenilyticus]|uniref:high frequency lysogenization protein HflD n=1 Tax=Flocculibacter collagenilyticus TaxID=2744479 RepID=UPI0018F6FA59|nr:high frequency lysogenization protein HflD [Flocculibacter collagenilyticus]